LRSDCAVSFTPRQLQKGEGLRKNGRLRDLFGVAEEALSGQELLQTLRGLFVVSRMKLRMRIRKLRRDGENSVEHDGMHVAKTYAKREVRHYVYLHDE
jgi:hypothetical protein